MKRVRQPKEELQTRNDKKAKREEPFRRRIPCLFLSESKNPVSLFFFSFSIPSFDFNPLWVINHRELSVSSLFLTLFLSLSPAFKTSEAEMTLLGDTTQRDKRPEKVIRLLVAISLASSCGNESWDSFSEKLRSASLCIIPQTETSSWLDKHDTSFMSVDILPRGSISHWPSVIF